jgi:heme exporter protein A
VSLWAPPRRKKWFTGARRRRDISQAGGANRSAAASFAALPTFEPDLVADSTNIAYVLADPGPSLGSEDGLPADVDTRRTQLAAVQLGDVAHRLGHRWVLRGITIRVEPGEAVAVIGTNGSGKTTLLRILATLLVPTRGSGQVFGRDLRTEADPVREITAMLGHATGLYDDLTATENLEFASRMLGLAAGPPSVPEVLEAVRMREHSGELVRNLSSGMRRRIALARVMLRRPRLLLLDEPYNSFDESGVGLVDQLIRDTVGAGGAALVATHDLARPGGAQFDRVIALSGGRSSEAMSRGSRP